MVIRSRALRESTVRALAKVGLVWALAVLGFVFTVGAAVGSSPAADSASDGSPSHSIAFVNTGEAPRTAGLALALVVLVGGLSVLVVGALRQPIGTGSTIDVPRLATPGDLSLTLGPDLAPASPTAATA